jgi:very-short-patch-repair endonuclease
MTDSQASHRVDPVILAHARELRREMTPQERTLWQRLRGQQVYGLRFRRQHPIHHFVVDFFCYRHKLVVEIDGHSHAEPEQQVYDQARTEWLTQHGLQVIRFTNHDVDTSIEGVLQEIARACGIEDLPPSNSPQRGED